MVSLALAILASGCASLDLVQSGSLSSYDNLGQQKGSLGKSRSFADPAVMATVKTVRIIPTRFSDRASGRIAQPQDRALVTHALDRALCIALSDRYQIVASDQPADLTIRNVISDVVPTGKAAAGVATAVSLGSSVVLPVSVPRLPVGLGGLAVEGEAVDATGTQRAAILWAKGANSITSKPRVSEVGDAYQLASAFGSDFSQLMIKGKMPTALDIALPSGQRINSHFGGKPKYAACDTFGREPGIPGMVAGMVGAPPEWTDKAGQKTMAP
ncbi:DUF3313 domain-containing protein [Rhizobium sp. FY34]|uniref:DUF3313 domain-containing protein n=1 Tax=Rhizobium sp. FY34 TaxID=2562309 RepID=UPI001FEE84CA|nr:DUF3313 domain-containing protein [Rhizobium sp. FY34]